jgi:hypothetical protein
MSQAERFLTPEVAEGLHRLRDEVPAPYVARSALFEIAFPASATRRDVQHGMGAIPTGFVSIGAQGGNVQLFDVATWTNELAFLSADAANTRVRGYFVIMEVPANA